MTQNSKKERKLKAEWTEEKEIGLLSLIILKNPYKAQHGKRIPIWQQISDDLKVKNGTDAEACRTKASSLIDKYKLQLKLHPKATGITENDDGNANEMHEKERLLSDIIDIQEKIEQTKENNQKNAKEKEDLQEKIRKDATKRLRDSQLSSDKSSNSGKSNKKPKFDFQQWQKDDKDSEEKTLTLLQEIADSQKEARLIDERNAETNRIIAENGRMDAETRRMENETRRMEAQTNSQMQGNMKDLIKELFGQLKKNDNK